MAILEKVALALTIALAGTIHAQQARFVGGTIIAIVNDKQRFVVVADSRSSDDTGKGQSDERCKIIGLNNKAFFAASGKTAIEAAPAGAAGGYRVVADIKESVRNVFSQSTKEPNAVEFMGLAFTAAEAIKAEVERWATAMPTIFASAREDIPLITSVLGGVTVSGDLVAYHIAIRFRRGTTTTIEVSVQEWEGGTPDDLHILGDVDAGAGIQEFFANRTARAQRANQKLAVQVAAAGGDLEILQLKAAVQAGIDWATNKNAIGGPLDVLELRRGGQINWIQRKPNCK